MLGKPRWCGIRRGLRGAIPLFYLILKNQLLGDLETGDIVICHNPVFKKVVKIHSI